MSAFFVMEGVIDDVVCLLMSSAMDGDELATKLGRELWTMNATALQSRYNDDPSEYAAAIANYTYVEPKAVDEVQHYKSLRCFTYQCYEGGVPDLDLFKRCERLEDELEDVHRNKKAAYDAAKWDRPRDVGDMARAFD